MGPAASFTPAQLHEAKEALDVAEQSYQDAPSAPRTRDLAYVAERRAQLANVLGETVAATRADQATTNSLHKQEETALVGTRSALQQTGAALQATGAALDAEHRRRLEAEKRAHDAMDKLAVAAALAVKEDTRGTIITLPGGVFFETNKATLLANAQQKLDQIVEALKGQEDRKIRVEGFTDSTGTHDLNMDLSKRRAESVRAYLVGHGIAADRVVSEGFGETRPVADNKNAEGRADNRRVEIVVQKIEAR